MKYQRTFPFNLVKHGAKIILYGAGKLGRKYWEQVTACQWCDIICVIDRNHQNIQDFPVEVYAPEYISEEVAFDNIVIAAILQKNREEIYVELLEMGISECKIVSSVEQFYMYDRLKVLSYDSISADEKKLSIAFCPMGTLGDYIVSLKFYQELTKYINDAVIDVYALSIVFAKCVFEELPFLGAVYEGSWDWGKHYDLVIETGVRINIVFFDKKRLQALAADLLRRIERLQERNKIEFSQYPVHSYYTSRLMVDRGRFFGENRYTSYGCEGIFDIKDNIVDLYVKDSAKREFSRLGLGKRYITFNYGADRYSKGEKPKNKMWPKEYHARLNQLLKNRYSDIEIVQLGAENIEKIPGADRYIMGEDLEIVKVILKNALCHIDCEGGLVHMATQLGTKCVVFFGPTPSWFFGYDENINIVSEKCKECVYMFPDWQINCHKYDRPECMYSITPETVLEKVSDYLESIRES